MVGNIIPYIGGEEEKSEKEPLRIWGKVEDGVIKPATEPVITCQCIRVPVLNGHTAAVFVKFRKNPTKEQLIKALVEFKGLPQELELPSAPKQFIQYLEEDNRPQVTEDVNFEHGMGVSVGRLREDTVYDWKFVGGRLIPVPREISASCGLAWKCGEQNEEETASYMKEQDLEYEKIYRILA